MSGFGFETKILMYDGAIKNIEDIYPGERIMGSDSFSYIVSTIERNSSLLYKVRYSNGTIYRVTNPEVIRGEFTSIIQFEEKSIASPYVFGWNLQFM